jgi:hypothetical protein
MVRGAAVQVFNPVNLQVRIGVIAGTLRLLVRI